MPHLAIVITVVNDSVLEVHFGELVTLTACPRDVGECQFGDLTSSRFAFGYQRVEAPNELEQIRVGVAVRRVDQRARQHGQPMAQAGRGLRIAIRFDWFRMQCQKNTAQAGVFANQQVIDAAVLEKLHCHALKRAPVVGDQRLAPAAMADHVGENGAVAVKSADAIDVIEDIGHAQAQLVVIGYRLAQFVKSGRIGHKKIAVIPQRAQVKIQLSFNVGEQRAVAFALQYRTAVCRFQLEVVDLPFRVAGVVMYAVIHPILQPGHGQQPGKVGGLSEEVRETRAGKRGVVAVYGAGGADHQVLRNTEIALQLIGRVELAGHRSKCLQHGRDGLAVRRLL